MHAGVAVVVLLAPARPHPVADLTRRSGRRGWSGCASAGCAAGSNRLTWRIANVSPGAGPVGDVQLDLGVGQCPGVGAAVLVDVGVLGELVLRRRRRWRLCARSGCRTRPRAGRRTTSETSRRGRTRPAPGGRRRPGRAARGSAGAARRPARRPVAAITTSSGSPAASATQVSTVAGAGNFNRGTWVFAILRVPVIGAHMPVDIEHRRLLGPGGHVPGRHRGDPVAGLTRPGQIARSCGGSS